MQKFVVYDREYWGQLGYCIVNVEYIPQPDLKLTCFLGHFLTLYRFNFRLTYVFSHKDSPFSHNTYVIDDRQTDTTL